MKRGETFPPSFTSTTSCFMFLHSSSSDSNREVRAKRRRPTDNRYRHVTKLLFHFTFITRGFYKHTHVQFLSVTAASQKKSHLFNIKPKNCLKHPEILQNSTIKDTNRQKPEKIQSPPSHFCQSFKPDRHHDDHRRLTCNQIIHKLSITHETRRPSSVKNASDFSSQPAN